uniref:Uncharacterized protein n=1 Tax=Oryza glumipatula TaxID=40148 RepID=A0A0D9Z8B9_9ORYZ
MSSSIADLQCSIAVGSGRARTCQGERNCLRGSEQIVAWEGEFGDWFFMRRRGDDEREARPP